MLAHLRRHADEVVAQSAAHDVGHAWRSGSPGRRLPLHGCPIVQTGSCGADTLRAIGATERAGCPAPERSAGPEACGRGICSAPRLMTSGLTAAQGLPRGRLLELVGEAFGRPRLVTEGAS